MEKPNFTLFKPFKFDYEEHEERVSIYKTFTPLHEDYDTDVCYFCSENVSNCICEQASVKFEPLVSMDLQKFVDLVPKDIELDEIKIRTYFDSGDYPTGYFIDLSYMKKVLSRPEAYIEDTKAYEEKVAKYNKEMVVYEAWAKQEEIKVLEYRLATLKKV